MALDNDPSIFSEILSTLNAEDHYSSHQTLTVWSD